MPFDRTCVHPFRLADDPDNLYVMIDARLVAEARAEMTAAQRTAFASKRWQPTQEQLDSGQVPGWAGNDPPAIYFRADETSIKTALRKRFRAPEQGEPAEKYDTIDAAQPAAEPAKV